MLTLVDALNKASEECNYCCLQVGSSALRSHQHTCTLYNNSNRDGCGRTGSFICIHSELERLKAEGVVNIFQSVKAMRSYRPGMVQDVV